MANETGHARNVESFQRLISFVQGYGAAYNPSNSSISLANLQAKLTASQLAINDVTVYQAPSKAAINDRETLYAPLPKLVTRVMNAYTASGTDENNVADAQTFARKIQGKRKSQPVPDDPATPEDESAVNHSASQRSYTRQVEHLDNLIAILSADPVYTPNETELNVSQLELLSANLKALNQAVIDAYMPLSNARIARDEVLYGDKTGLCDLAKLVKNYVKSVFGAGSAEYTQISGLKFKPRS